MLKTLAIILICIVAALAIGFAAFKFAIRPWYLRWGATDAELTKSLPGDELLPQPAVIQTNAITIQAPPEKIYPWLAQLGQDKGGFYSLDWLENLAGCDIHNADSIHAEWQDVKPGSQILMYPREKSGPPPFIVASVQPGRSLIAGHHPDAALSGETWTDVWQFVLEPMDAHTTRLIIRTRTNMVGGIWDIVEPVSFIMQRGMMFGIRERAEKIER